MEDVATALNNSIDELNAALKDLFLLDFKVHKGFHWQENKDVSVFDSSIFQLQHFVQNLTFKKVNTSKDRKVFKKKDAEYHWETYRAVPKQKDLYRAVPKQKDTEYHWEYYNDVWNYFPEIKTRWIESLTSVRENQEKLYEIFKKFLHNFMEPDCDFTTKTLEVLFILLNVESWKVIVQSIMCVIDKIKVFPSKSIAVLRQKSPNPLFKPKPSEKVTSEKHETMLPSLPKLENLQDLSFFDHRASAFQNELSKLPKSSEILQSFKERKENRKILTNLYQTRREEADQVAAAQAAAKQTRREEEKRVADAAQAAAKQTRGEEEKRVADEAAAAKKARSKEAERYVEEEVQKARRQALNKITANEAAAKASRNEEKKIAAVEKETEEQARREKAAVAATLEQARLDAIAAKVEQEKQVAKKNRARRQEAANAAEETRKLAEEAQRQRNKTSLAARFPQTLVPVSKPSAPPAERDLRPSAPAQPVPQTLAPAKAVSPPSAPTLEPISADSAAAASATASEVSDLLPVHLLSELIRPGPYPAGVNTDQRELYLSDNEFLKVFLINKKEFQTLAKWRQAKLKRDAKLF